MDSAPPGTHSPFTVTRNPSSSEPFSEIKMPRCNQAHDRLLPSILGSIFGSALARCLPSAPSAPPSSPPGNPENYRIWKRWLNVGSHAFVDALYPPFCILCHTPAPEKSGSIAMPLCLGCETEARSLRLPLATLPAGAQAQTQATGPASGSTEPQGSSPSMGPSMALCLQCSRSFHGAPPLPPRCADCETRNPAFNFAVASHRTTGVIRELIHKFKYEGARFLAGPLADWLHDSLNDPRLKSPPPDFIVPIPLHWWKQLRRGFNQSALLAHELSRRTRLPVLDALRRIRSTGTQTQLTRHERLSNLTRAFRVRPRVSNELRGKHILLLDDVITTGSTLDACARELQRADAASVRALAVTRG
jgi:competence protein ComFC